METKNSIRKEKLALRGSMTSKEQIEKSKMIMQKVLELDCIKRAESVLCYAGYQSEVQTEELIRALISMGKKVFLPRVIGDDMEFYRIESDSDMTKGYKGIPEPAICCNESYSYQKNTKDVMIMPGCAFSKDGFRIGYGKGYYDRYLENHDMVERVALCFSLQIAEHIPTDTFDKKASMLVTELEVIDCFRQSSIDAS